MCAAFTKSYLKDLKPAIKARKARIRSQKDVEKCVSLIFRADKKRQAKELKERRAAKKLAAKQAKEAKALEKQQAKEAKAAEKLAANEAKAAEKLKAKKAEKEIAKTEKAEAKKAAKLDRQDLIQEIVEKLGGEETTQVAVEA